MAGNFSREKSDSSLKRSFSESYENQGWTFWNRVTFHNSMPFITTLVEHLMSFKQDLIVTVFLTWLFCLLWKRQSSCSTGKNSCWRDLGWVNVCRSLGTHQKFFVKIVGFSSGWMRSTLHRPWMGDSINWDEIFKRNLYKHKYVFTDNYWNKWRKWKSLRKSGHVGVQNYQGGWWWTE